MYVYRGTSIYAIFHDRSPRSLHALPRIFYETGIEVDEKKTRMISHSRDSREIEKQVFTRVSVAAREAASFGQLRSTNEKQRSSPISYRRNRLQPQRQWLRTKISAPICAYIHALLPCFPSHVWILPRQGTPGRVRGLFVKENRKWIKYRGCSTTSKPFLLLFTFASPRWLSPFIPLSIIPYLHPHGCLKYTSMCSLFQWSYYRASGTNKEYRPERRSSESENDWTTSWGYQLLVRLDLLRSSSHP